MAIADTIEGEAAKVTNGVARIGANTANTAGRHGGTRGASRVLSAPRGRPAARTSADHAVSRAESDPSRRS
jgi:hypothetical protein